MQQIFDPEIYFVNEEHLHNFFRCLLKFHRYNGEYASACHVASLPGYEFDLTKGLRAWDENLFHVALHAIVLRKRFSQMTRTQLLNRRLINYEAYTTRDSSCI